MTLIDRNFMFALALLLPSLAAAQNGTLVAEGSTPTTRNNSDAAPGQVYIYTGGNFPIGTAPTSLEFIWNFQGALNRTGVLTPLLFEESVSGAYIVYTVIGIGRGFPISFGAAPNTIPFDIVAGARIANGHTTFGFVNGFVDAGGNQYVSTRGVVDYINPDDGGVGVGGPGTSDLWNFVDYDPVHPSVALGTTFGPSGSGATYSFYNQTRTYSAEAFGFVKVK